MRIASLSPAATEILFALGLGRDVLCRDQFSNFPEEAKSIVAVKDHQNIDPQEVARFTPELIFTGTVIQKALAEKLKAAGMSPIHQDPRTLDQVLGTIREIGLLTSREAEASALILKMQQGFNAVKTKARLLPKKLRVYVEEWHRPPMASGNWVPEIVRVAGGEPFPIHGGQLSREVTLDEVSRFAPDLIVISWCGAGSLADLSLLTSRPGWDALQAVQERRVRVIDDSLLNRPGPRLVDGAQRLYGWMFEQLH